MSTELILSQAPKIELFTFQPAALQQRDRALEISALIGKVENAEQNTQAVQAHIELKRISSGFEKQRKALKEPLLDAGRKLDRLVATELLEVEKEIGRISNLTAQFQIAEQRRVFEEQELQRKELARIEAEKQAEIARIAREQAAREAEARRVQEEAERKAREEREAAAKAARDATNKKQREAAQKLLEEAAKAEEANRIERERLAAESAARAASEMQLANERAQAAAAAEAKPITATRSFGQSVKQDWEIRVLNPYDLARFHPDCVTITPLLTPIKQLLNQGITVKGVMAHKVTKSNVRVANGAIDV